MALGRIRSSRSERGQTSTIQTDIRPRAAFSKLPWIGFRASMEA
jgi:hypothetical protein